MSTYFSEKFKNLIPYTPGEQPQDMEYIKLNTNESPFPPSETAISLAQAAAKTLRLYSDPENKDLVSKIADEYGVKPSQIIVTNGSDEVLNFAFMAFADKDHPLLFPNITYGFYPVFAKLNNIPYKEIPLRDDFTINYSDYVNCGGTVVIANPNAPTGLLLSLKEIEKIIASNPQNIVIIDEAYIDFGGESAIKLINTYDNLLITQTFSKSRSMAGARLGFGIGNAELIADLNTIKYSTNPYNVNRMTAAAGYGALCDKAYFEENCKKIIDNRNFTANALKSLKFEVLDSKANFIFARSSKIDGKTFYAKLKKRGILVRHFDNCLITQFNRISIGTREQMEKFIQVTQEILEVN